MERPVQAWKLTVPQAKCHIQSIKIGPYQGPKTDGIRITGFRGWQKNIQKIEDIMNTLSIKWNEQTAPTEYHPSPHLEESDVPSPTEGEEAEELLDKARTRIQDALCPSLFEGTKDLEDALAEVRGKAQPKSRANPAGSWLTETEIGKRQVSDDDPSAEADSSLGRSMTAFIQGEFDVIINDDTDREDEVRLLDPSYRARVLAATAVAGIQNTSRCSRCLRLTRARQECSQCHEWCCSRDCIRITEDSEIENEVYTVLCTHCSELPKDDIPEIRRKPVTEPNQRPKTKAMPRPKGSAGHNKIVSDQEAGNVLEFTVETGARSEDSEGSLFSIWSGYLSAAEKSDDDADLLTEIINDSIKETHPDAEQDTGPAAPVIPSMSGRALDAFLEEDSADRKPFGPPEGEFLGEAPNGSPKDAATP